MDPVREKIPRLNSGGFNTRPRTLEGNIRMNIKEIGMNTRNWVDSAQERGY